MPDADNPGLDRTSCRLTADLLPSTWRGSARHVNYAHETVNGRPNCKIPKNPHTGGNASSVDPETWGTLEQANARDPQHVGRVIGEPELALDFDHCVSEAGDIESWALGILNSVPATYTEFSPSGKGIHAWYQVEGAAKLPDGRRCDDFEIYTRKRYFTLTGRRLQNTPLELARLTLAEAQILYTKLEARREALKNKNTSRTEQATDGSRVSNRKYQLLKEGKIEEAGFDNVSSAVQSFLTYSAYFNLLDAEKIDADFRSSGLHKDWRPFGKTSDWTEKWARRKNEEIEAACKIAKEWIERERAADDVEGISIAPGNLLESVIESENVLLRSPELQYFSRRGDLVKPSMNAQPVPGLQRDRVAVVIQPANHLTVLRDLASKAKFKAPRGKNGWQKADPPERIAHHLIDRAARGEGAAADYRRLDFITSCPTLLPDGSVLDKPDRHQDGVYYLLRNEFFPPIPESPTHDEACAALKKFDSVFHKFPFVARDGEPWDKTPAYAAVLASILSLAARPAIPLVPLFGVTAPEWGSGKTKVVESATYAATGWRPSTCSYVNAEEFEKMLVPILRAGDRSILIDNISQTLRGDRLCSVLTSEERKERLLGRSDEVRLLNRAVFFATGSNLTMSGDLAARRALMIAIDPNCEQPETREFDFDPVQRAAALYPELVVAAVTALRAYIVAGKPKVLSRALLGSYEQWDELVCGTLVWCGYADPNSTRALLRAADPQREKDIELLSTWHRHIGDRLIPIAELFKDGAMKSLITSQVGDGGPEKLRWRLTKLEGRILDGYKLVIDRSYSSRVATYSVTRLFGEPVQGILCDDNLQEHF